MGSDKLRKFIENFIRYLKGRKYVIFFFFLNNNNNR